MTKKEMVYEILSYTTYNGLSERKVLAKINRLKKERVELVYNQFVKDREHANFYYSIL